MKAALDGRGRWRKMSTALNEYEGEFEGEYEGEQMIRRVLAGARRMLGRSGGGDTASQPSPRRPQSPGFVQTVGRRLIPTLVRVLATDPSDVPFVPPERPPVSAPDERRGAAAGPPPEREFEFESEGEGEFEDEYEGEFEGEDEGEFEGEYEFEDESAGGRQRLRPPALMRYLGHAARRAESEDEAEAFVGALVPLAAQAVPQAASSVMRVAPQLISGLSQAARTMRRSPQTRPLVSTLPGIMQRTAASLAHSAAQGRPVTPQSATRTLARQTAYVLGTPGVKEQMMGGAGRPRGFGRPIPPPDEDRSPAGQSRRATTAARRARVHFRRGKEILQDAQAQANVRTPQQEF